MANYYDYDEENQQEQGSEIDTGQLIDDAKDLYEKFKDHTSPKSDASSQDVQSPKIADISPEQSELLSGSENTPEVDYSAIRNSERNVDRLTENAAQAQETSAEASEIGGIATETAEGMAEGAAKDVAVQAAERGAEKGAEAAASAGAEAAAAGAAEGATTAGVEAGASSTGVGAVAVAIYEAAKATCKVATSWGKIITGETRKSGFGWIMWIILLLVMFNGNMNYTYKTTFGSMDENYAEGQYSDKFDIKDTDWGFNWFFNMFDNEEDEIGEYDSEKEFTEGCDRAKKYINKGFERALDIAKKSELPWIISKEGYDYELTMASYENEEEHFYDDVNYAEIIEVIQQKKELNSENLTYKEFKKLFNPVLKPWKLQLLYRMKVEPDWAEKTIEHYDLEGHVIDTTTVKVLYGKVTLRHYDLKSLYRFIEVDAFDFNSQVDNMININLLDESEENLRCYADYYEFGPYKRTEWDYGFDESEYVYSGALLREFERIIIGDINPDEELKVGDIMFYSTGYNNRYKNITHVAIYAGNDMMVDASSGKGVVVYRSVYSGLNPKRIVSICRPLSDDDDEARQQLLDFALSQCGKKYSLENRTSEGYYDCSSFVSAVYRSIGIEFGGYAPVAADICKYNENAGNLIAISYPRSK